MVNNYFCKLPEADARPNQQATIVTKVLINMWICRFGVPIEIHSNEGRNFVSNLFQRITEVHGIRKHGVRHCIHSQMGW